MVCGLYCTIVGYFRTADTADKLLKLSRVSVLELDQITRINRDLFNLDVLIISNRKTMLIGRF